MSITTTNSFNNKYKYYGVVNGVSVRSLSMMRQFVVGLKSVFGGKMNLIEEKINEAKLEAMNKMIEQARQKGANSVIGVKLNVSEISANKTDGYIVFSSTGTAVKK